MAKLKFLYGTMNSKKTADLLAVAHSYSETGRYPLLVTSQLDTRSNHMISSRIGVSAKPDIILKDGDSLVHAVDQYLEDKNYSIVLVDEAQFLTINQIEQLALLVDDYDLPVMAYGLKTDFRGTLFPASKRLLEISDEIEEIRSICWYCSRKATMNIRVDESGNKVSEGKTVQIGGNLNYQPVCRYHFVHGGNIHEAISE